MFTSLIGTFQGFFSRAFWFGNFLPVAIFTAIHLAIASWQYPATVQVWYWITGPNTVTSVFPLVTATLVILAYVLAPFVPMMRSVLDASRLPPQWRDALHRRHVAYAHRVRAEVDTAFDRFNVYASLQQSSLATFWDARRRCAAEFARREAERQPGESIWDAAETRAPQQTPAIDTLTATIGGLTTTTARGDLPNSMRSPTRRRRSPRSSPRTRPTCPMRSAAAPRPMRTRRSSTPRRTR